MRTLSGIWRVQLDLGLNLMMTLWFRLPKARRKLSITESGMSLDWKPVKPRLNKITPCSAVKRMEEKGCKRRENGNRKVAHKSSHVTKLV